MVEAPVGISGTNSILAAHELGHNLNMGHDGDGNTCPDNAFIMAPTSFSHYDLFSPCSIHEFASFHFYGTFDGDTSCMITETPVCGDGHVDINEQCDCGALDCTGIDPCCEGSTCQFKDSMYECSPFNVRF